MRKGRYATRFNVGDLVEVRARDHPEIVLWQNAMEAVVVSIGWIKAPDRHLYPIYTVRITSRQVKRKGPGKTVHTFRQYRAAQLRVA